MMIILVRILVIYDVLVLISCVNILSYPRFKALFPLKRIDEDNIHRRLSQSIARDNHSTIALSDINTIRTLNSSFISQEDSFEEEYDAYESNSSIPSHSQPANSSVKKKRLLKNAEGIIKSKLHSNEQMTYIQTMFTGALSRTIAQTVMHPVNTYKTMLQLNRLADILYDVDYEFKCSHPDNALFI
jgi:uncharacterized glyoxalase superfamily metalloenzyme YdcJ